MSNPRLIMNLLKLDLERSARYHNMRGHFLRKRHTFLMALIIAIGGTSVFGLADFIAKAVVSLGTFAPQLDLSWFDSDTASTLIGIAIAGLGSYDLLGGFSTSAAEHLSFERAYNDMLAEANQLDETDTEALKRLKFRADAISMTSEGMYRVINALAHNQVMVSHGYKNHKLKVNRIYAFFANYALFSGTNFSKDDLPTSKP